jgi:hypothetical protein
MKLLREPLLHFLLLGAIVFAAYSLVSRHRTDAPGEIVVTRGKVENLTIGFTRTWQRPPSEQELQGLIRDYVREEAAYRKALAMGLDRDDTIIRRRLQQKLEFVSENAAAGTEPTDAELETYLQSHPDNFKTETTFTFRHVYLNPQAHGSSLSDDTVRTLATLRRDGSNADLNTIGDPFMLEHQFERIPVAEVSKMFGQQFASALSSLQPGQWQGPVLSGFGTHLVFVSERAEGHLPALAEVRTEVQREWAHAKRVEAENKFYQGLLQHYTVRIEPLEEKRMAEVRQ